MLLFTDYMQDKVIYFYSGYSFLCIMFVCFGTSIMLIVASFFQRCRRSYIKKQKIKNFKKERARLSQAIHTEPDDQAKKLQRNNLLL